MRVYHLCRDARTGGVSRCEQLPDGHARLILREMRRADGRGRHPNSHRPRDLSACRHALAELRRRLVLLLAGAGGELPTPELRIRAGLGRRGRTRAWEYHWFSVNAHGRNSTVALTEAGWQEAKRVHDPRP